MSKKKEKKKQVDFLQSVINIFESNPKQKYNPKQIASIIDLSKNMRDTLEVALDGLVVRNVLEQPEPGRYIYKEPEERFVEGRVDMTKQGAAYITPVNKDDETEDVFVSEHNMNHALHGDIVRVKLFNKKQGKSEGEITEILEETKRTFVGKIEVSGNYGFVIADSRNMPYDIFIPNNELKDVKNGQKVLARITEWKKGVKSPTGEIVDILGDSGNNDTEMHSILAEFDLPYKYPDHIEKLAKRIPDKISEEEYQTRRDFRQITTLTIDPKDAKDFDDALSIIQIENDTWEVGVHIADVTHYVKPDSAIDFEAQERATSIYLVDRTVPMLPERLSNNICSLRPNEEKLCFSAVFELNSKGTITKEWYGRTVIKSSRRFTYEEAQTVIETGQGDYCTEILKLNELAQILRQKRFKAGAVTFEREEPRFELDDKGKPIAVYFKEMKESNHLIEEFMLLANRKVAEKIGRRKADKKAPTFVYRIHDKPNPDKLQSFGDFIKRFGYSMKIDDQSKISGEMNKVLKEVKGKPEADLIETLAVRSMAKAKYTTDNIGHYGLGFEFYTHFTSPIRRYPDMMVHRLLAQYLAGGKSADKDYYEQMCKHSSLMEQRSADAERASIKYKMIEFMQDKVGNVYEGMISGVTEWGIYVELIETKIEGMASVRNMKDDYYYYDEDNYCIKGRSTGKIYTLGNRVTVKILAADLQNKHLDFAIVNPELESYDEAKRTVKNSVKKQTRRK